MTEFIDEYSFYFVNSPGFQPNYCNLWAFNNLERQQEGHGQEEKEPVDQTVNNETNNEGKKETKPAQMESDNER